MQAAAKLLAHVGGMFQCQHGSIGKIYRDQYLVDFKCMFHGLRFVASKIEFISITVKWVAGSGFISSDFFKM
jgi:hypothetical protein